MLAGHPDDTQALRDIGVGLIHVGEALELLGDQEGAPEIYLQLPLGEKLVRADPDSSRTGAILPGRPVTTAPLGIAGGDCGGLRSWPKPLWGPDFGRRSVQLRLKAQSTPVGPCGKGRQDNALRPNARRMWRCSAIWPRESCSNSFAGSTGRAAGVRRDGSQQALASYHASSEKR